MVLISPRIQFYEINDQPWFPQYLRLKVQSCLTLAWTFKVPLLQPSSPAHLVAHTLFHVLSARVTDYTYVDFCAGAGGPTPFIERDLNASLSTRNPTRTDANKGASTAVPSTPVASTAVANGSTSSNLADGRAVEEGGRASEAVKFILTDISPHIPDWTEAAKKSQNLTFIPRSVDATNAPADLVEGNGKIFRLFNLAFHHFDDSLGGDIVRNTADTADGFGIFELQERTFSSLLMMFLMGGLFFLITPFYFWRSPGHLFFTYIIPIIPFVVVIDGYISALRTRTPEEVLALWKRANGDDLKGWKIMSGKECHTKPIGYMTWIIGVKE